MTLPGDDNQRPLTCVAIATGNNVPTYWNCVEMFAPSHLRRHVGEQKGLVAVFLTPPVVPGGGEVATVEAAVLVIGVLCARKGKSKPKLVTTLESTKEIARRFQCR